MADSGALSFLEVCSGGYSVSQAAVHPEYPQLHFLTAPMHCQADSIDLTAFSAFLTQAKQQFQYVFLDAPAGVDAGFRLCARFADRIVLVTGSDPASIRDAARTGELLELMKKNAARIIVNRVNEKQYRTVGITVDDVMDSTGLPLLGIVPEDPDVALAAAFGKPLLKQTKKGAAKACLRIAKRIQGLPVPISIR